MSEKTPLQGPELKLNSAEHEPNSHEQETQAHEKLQEAHEDGQKPSVEALINKVEKEALSSSEYRKEEKKPASSHPALVNKQLKDMAYSRALVRTRKHLSIASRVFSKAVHSKILDRPSESIGKTIARPSSMMGGAIVAFIGTSLLLWITKKYGYEYNYLAAVLLFGIGMILGLVVESLFKLVKKRR